MTKFKKNQSDQRQYWPKQLLMVIMAASLLLLSQTACGDGGDDEGDSSEPNDNSNPTPNTTDTTAPTFGNAPSLSASGDASLTFSATINEDGDIHWVLLTDGAAAPSRDQVIAATDSMDRDEDAANTEVAASGSEAAVADTAVSFTATGLDASTSYDLYSVAVDDAGNPSAVMEVTAATLAPGDTTAPTFGSAPSLSASGDASLTFSATINEDGDIHWVLLTDGAAAPSRDQVIAATDSMDRSRDAANTEVEASGSEAAVAGTAVSFTATGLDASTSYDLYSVAVDDAGNPSAVATATATTLASGSPELSNVALGALARTTAEVSFTLADRDAATTDRSIIHWLAVLQEETTIPTLQEVIAGTTAIGTSVAIAGMDSDVMAIGEGSITVTGLDGSRGYKLYLAAVDKDNKNSGILQSPPDVPALPLVPTDLAISVEENQLSGTEIIDLEEEVTGETTATYSYTAGDDAAPNQKFAFDAATGVLTTTATPLDYESLTDPWEYVLTFAISAENARGRVPETAGTTATLTLTVTITDQPSVDMDGDGLIEIRTALQLAAIGNDLNGDGIDDSAPAGAQAPDGCPEFGESALGAKDGSCIGYELGLDDSDSVTIDLEGSDSNRWTPIGNCGTNGCGEGSDNDDQPFRAIFEGNGNTITNLYIENSGSGRDILGLFGYLKGATVRNLTLSEIYIKGKGSANSGIGALAGYVEGVTTVSAITVTDSDSETDIQAGDTALAQFTGGLVGYMDGENALIIDSDVGGTLSIQAGDESDESIGGLVGNVINGKIVACNVLAGVVVQSGAGSANYVGGLVGEIEIATVIASSAAATINGGTGNAHWIGGLVGRIQRSTSLIVASYTAGTLNCGSGDRVACGGLGGNVVGGSIIASYSKATVNGGDTTAGRGSYAGLVAGIGDGFGGNYVGASYASGDVTGRASNEDWVGGLFGNLSAGAVVASFATGAVDGGVGDNELIGALVANPLNNPTITDSYGFGTTANEGAGGTVSALGAIPAALTGVSAAADLAGDDSTPTTYAGDTWHSTVWDFGDGTQAPALKYVDGYDADTDTYTCDSASFGSITVVCGTTLLPGQRP